ncbi:hypothetical protein ACTOB_002957 [Actinoplanes oblitus]|uniref:Uncharacterized protein n=1 Tax=Actinoplanes oblitus TaxID=3040509 RepID=A0ABY8WPC3_9ACTN|nr:hypothetical protein [Actinoplanes oblitus]WIM99307.1 hypothetical protein ACTOB_002957 [Actinoplanes oblitus]
MAADCDMLATSAATTLVALMGTAAWRPARSLLAGVWQRNAPDQAGGVREALDGAERIVAMARGGGDVPVARGCGDVPVARGGGAGAVADAVRTDWRQRIAAFLAANPDAGNDLREAVRQMSALSRSTLTYSRPQDFGRHYLSAGEMLINE